MTLDMPTISAVSIAVTAILGFVLVHSWWRAPTSPLTGWWGAALLIMTAGIAMAAAGSVANAITVVTLGQATILLSAALMWMAVRQFEGRPFRPLAIVAWPAAFLAIAFSGVLDTFDERLLVASAILAILSYATAIEFARDPTEQLGSRGSAVAILILVATGYLAWLPLTMAIPIGEASYVFSIAWFPAVVLIALLGRVALAFVVLAMVKEREELKQRHDALTDPLTGLPNRRALFDAADELARHSKYLRGDPISVLVFDLDHFKKINDTFGHRLGDRVLQLFAYTMAEKVETGSILGRLGGEEFAAILPGADLQTAAKTAESVRAAFADCALAIDGARIAATVSVGAASHDDIDCDLGALFHRADGALYAAKNNGRNRVELLGPREAMIFDDGGVAMQTALNRRDGLELPSFAKWRTARRYRRSQARVQSAGAVGPGRVLPD
jgi:diguanylate cyclase (GGDEF)-like protein